MSAPAIFAVIAIIALLVALLLSRKALQRVVEAERLIAEAQRQD